MYRIVGNLPGQQYFDIDANGNIIVRYNPKVDPLESTNYTVSFLDFKNLKDKNILPQGSLILYNSIKNNIC